MSIDLEKQILEKGLTLFKDIKSHKESIFDKQYWMGLIMEWVMKDPLFKINLFRFVDVLPSLKTKEQISSHIEEYLLKQDLPLVISTALKAASSSSITASLAQSSIKNNIADMAKRFIIGDSISAAKKTLTKLHEQGFLFTIDLLGEAVLSEEEANSYYLKLSEIITEVSSLPNPNVSIKITSLSSKLKSLDPDYSVELLKARLWPLLRQAKNHNVFINFDMESYQSLEIINKLFTNLMFDQEFIDWPNLGIVVQAYLKRSQKDLENLVNLAKKRATPITVRLVKGAYWDYEVIKSRQTGIACPVFEEKAASDVNFESLTRILINNYQITRPAFGSHNIRSLSNAICYAQSKNLTPKDYEIQMLYGMADVEKKVFLKQGYNVRIYSPMGELLEGMSYLVRRLLENTSQMGFVKMAHHDQQNETILLAKPQLTIQEKVTNSDFKNAPFTDFCEEQERKNFITALQNFQNALPYKVPIVIDGQASYTNDFAKFNPSCNQQQIAHISFANLEQAQKALTTCVNNQQKLVSIGLDERIKHLENLAEILHRDRVLLSAAMCLEVSKTFEQADAEIAEAIDFCNFYAQCAQKLKADNLYSLSGESNWQYYKAKGPSLIIAPWNFPLAILCGMSIAAYVAGNSIIMKPAESSSLTGYLLYERMIRAGFLSSCVQFLPGVGEEIGQYLVTHKDIATICFTGSKNVGLEIINTANKYNLKRIICEMGGKNAMIIDDDADLDEAVVACIKSAFEFSGQKCSALSRIILLESIADTFIKRFIQASKKLTICESSKPFCDMAAVIDKDAFERIKKVIEALKQDPSIKILYEGQYVENGFFIPPVIVQTSDKNHICMQEEFFAPIVAIYTVKDLDEAIDIANHTEFALTGGFFSRSPKNIAKVTATFAVGNLYINQKCTGANVKRQPFGGFKMSGLGAKAGGLDYLYNFVDITVVSENTMRKGFSPDVSG